MGIGRLRRAKDADIWLPAIVGVLLLGGVIMVYSASAMWADTNFSGDSFFFLRQIVWVIVSVAMMMLISRIDYRRMEKWVWVLLICSFALLVLVLFTRPISGARRWIDLYFFKLQPSEIFKYVLIIFLAAMLAAKKDKIRHLRSVLFPALPVLAVGFGLILAEPNLGTVLILSLMVLVLLFVAGIRVQLLALFSGAIGLVAYLMVFVGGYKIDRIHAWWNALEDPLQAGYQVKQSILAIGSGGVIGAGLGRGSAKMLYLPAPHTDFIFATLAEEGGFIIVMLLLLLYLLFIWRGTHIAMHAPDLFGFFIAVGVTTIIGGQALMNLMVATALIPVTGLPLPLLSYGGSSLILTCCGIGLLLAVSRQRVASPQLFRGGAQ
ncbi:MAG: putative lipid II flippase FtsW [bacterium]